ncbi:hypothetical protein COPCOM_03115 [Coprococcus comes ATCC 27758]|uniref:Uncharacterized protein n=1 Tax=Coprococcus comes ATCC 27758 TaxID=470146 RepID=C0BD74_9FIRM|nr:hypothetical protein COPCOM_03115 [Coprococcus comes ATCC 27758]
MIINFLLSQNNDTPETMAQNYIDSIAKMRRAGNAELKREKTNAKI